MLISQVEPGIEVVRLDVATVGPEEVFGAAVRCHVFVSALVLRHLDVPIPGQGRARATQHEDQLVAHPIGGIDIH